MNESIQNRQSALSWMKTNIRTTLFEILLLSLFNGLAAAGSIAGALIFKQVVDTAVAADRNSFFLNLGLYAAVLLVQVLLFALSRRLLEWSTVKLESRIIGAKDRSTALEYELFCAVRKSVADSSERIQSTARALARLDTVCSLAEVAEKRGYVCPRVDDSGEISEELKECAEVIAQTDMRMLNIRRKIEEKECPDKLLRFDRD